MRFEEVYNTGVACVNIKLQILQRGLWFSKLGGTQKSAQLKAFFETVSRQVLLQKHVLAGRRKHIGESSVSSHSIALQRHILKVIVVHDNLFQTRAFATIPREHKLHNSSPEWRDAKF